MGSWLCGHGGHVVGAGCRWQGAVCKCGVSVQVSASACKCEREGGVQGASASAGVGAGLGMRCGCGCGYAGAWVREWGTGVRAHMQVALWVLNLYNVNIDTALK
jgi:hypothetical protein